MIEALIIAGAIAASAILFYLTFRPREDIRITARTLVRATEKRGEWDATINSEHIKRARVALVLLDKWPEVDPEWVSIIIEEAVFDMEADRDTNKCRCEDGSTGTVTGQHIGYDEFDDGTTGRDNESDPWYVGDRTTSDSGDATGWPVFETGPEDLEIPSSE